MKEKQRANILFNTFVVYTLITYVWILVEFISKGGTRAPSALTVIYITALTLYVGDKEIKRLRMKYQTRLRPGEYFVYLWGATFIVASVLVLFLGDESGFHIPNDLATNAGVVILFYFVTDALKTRERRKTHGHIFGHWRKKRR